jgi:hypothetical protein
MAITPLPTPPSRDDPTNFAARGDAFLGALPDFATEANALAVDVNADAVAAAAAETAATAAAAAATAAANVTKWVSGTTYTEGVVVWSPITYLSYRRKSTGGGTTDPSADSTNWAQAAGTGDVTQTGTQTLTNKTIEAGTFTNGYTEETVTANTSTAYTIDLANGTVQYLTLTGNCTYTFPTPVAGKSFTLIQKQDGTGGRTVTWPASVDWPGATAPTLTATASKADKFVFTAIDGSNWLGSVAGQNYTV